MIHSKTNHATIIFEKGILLPRFGILLGDISLLDYAENSR